MRRQERTVAKNRSAPAAPDGATSKPTRRGTVNSVRGRLAKLEWSGDPPCTTAFRLKEAADVLAPLEEQVNRVRSARGATDMDKARVIGFLASVALKAIAAGDIAARLEALE